MMKTASSGENDKRKTKAQLITVLAEVRQRVSQLETAEEMLRESEEKFRTLFESSSDALMTLEPPAWRFTSGNPAAVEMFRAKSVEEFLACAPETLSSEQQPGGRASTEKSKEMIEEALREGSHLFEWTHKRINGEEFSASVLLTRMEFAGKPFLQATVRDITERKRAEEVLRESEERYRRLVESMPDVAYTFSSKRGGVYYSPRVEQVLGYSAEYLYAHPLLWNESIHPDDRPRISEIIGEFGAGKFFDVEYRIQAAQGNWLWLRDRSIGCSVGDDEILVEGLATDITERKQAEEELRLRATRLNEAQEIANMGSFSFEVSGHRVETSPQLDKILGLDTDQEKNANAWSDLLHPDDRTAMDAAVADCLEFGTPFDRDYRIIRRSDGETRWLHVTARAEMDFSGKVVRFTGVNIDVTERKRAEQALRESEGRYRVVIEWTLAAILVHRGGQIVYANPAAVKMFGATSMQDLAGKAILDRVHPAFHQLALARASDITDQGGEASILEERLLKLDGTAIDAEVQSTSIVYDGELALCTSIRDITARKQAEEALIESSAQFRTLFEASPDAIILIDPHDRWCITDCNTAACQMNGYTRDELIGQSIDLLNLTPGQSAERAEYLEQIRQNGILHMETFHRRKDGTLFPIEVSTSLMTLGRRDMVLGIDRDITDRKRVEDAIRRERSLLRTLIDNLPDVVYVKDAAGRKIVANRVDVELIGAASEADVLGKTDLELFPHEVGARGYADDQALMQSGQPLLNREEDFVGADGVRRWLLTSKVPLYDEHKHSLGLLGIGHDITERKRAAETLRDLNTTLEQRVADRTRQLAEANAQLTELDRLKDEFVARISHELYTPLVNIKLYLGLLDHGKPEKHNEYMETLRHEAARLQQLIDDLLRISQLDMLASQLPLAPIDVNQLLAQLVIDQSGRARERNLRIDSQPAPNLPRATADSTLLLQALSNLMTNAMNYTPSGSMLMLSTALQPGDNQAWVTCTIRDTGPGISAKDRPHIFERFYRGEAAKDYTLPGTGLGLSISQEIIEKMGGRITVENVSATEGSGVAFTVWLKPAD